MVLLEGSFHIYTKMSDQERVQKRIKAIIKHFGADYFHGIKVLDVGSGDGTVARTFADMGAKVTCLDARKLRLDAIYNSNPSIRCIRADLDQEWPFHNDFFEVTLHLGTLNHLMYVEKHLQFICQNTNHLVLESQVCDSSNPSKYVLVKENKSNVDHAYNGVGCRPSPAFIERILANAGMEHMMLDDSSCNSGKFVYDWVGKDSNSIQQGLSRLWFARRHALRQTVQEPAKETFNASKRWVPPPAVLPAPEQPRQTIPVLSSIGSTAYTVPKHIGEDPVKRDSKEFGLVFAEQIPATQTFATSGVVLPLTISSKQWLKKIMPLFPNLRVHALAHTMRDFSKSKADPDLVICSITNLYPAKRVWIEEWDNYKLTANDVKLLNDYELVMTPSIINEHQIKMVAPLVNVKKVDRPWPFYPGVSSSSHYIYFEKDPNHTQILSKAWKEEYGKIVVVGSTIKMPDNFVHVPDTENYQEVCNVLQGTKAIIDITNNTYYMSGVISLAKAMGLPVISTNQLGYDNSRHVLISGDRAISPYPSIEQIQKSIDKFNQHPKARNYTNDAYNHSVNTALKKMLGNNA